jgi:hypothetical protein
MAEDFWQTVELPGGKKFKYDSRLSLDRVIADYNAAKPPGYPPIRRGAGFGLRATLSGASEAMKEATIAKKYPWQTELYTGLGGTKNLSAKAKRMSANRERLIFDPESNTLFTLDEPGLSMGDVADVLRPATSVGTEVATGLMLPEVKGGILAANALKGMGQRVAGVAAGGTVGDVAYEAGAKLFGGLEDPRTVLEQSGDIAGDFMTRAAFEGLAAGASIPMRAGLKKAGRGGAKLEETASGLGNFKSTFLENPPTLGAVTGPGSRIQVFENYVVNNYPATSPKLKDAIDSVDGIVRRRVDEVTERAAPWGGEGKVGKTRTGETTITGIEGKPKLGGRLNEREGGWADQMNGIQTGLMEKVDEVFPPYTIVDPTDLKNLYKELQKQDVSKENLGHLKFLLNKMTTQKNITVSDVRELASVIGPQSNKANHAYNPAAGRIYAVAKNTIHQAADGNTEATLRVTNYDRTMEGLYDEMSRRLQKVTRATGGVATPVEASKKMSGFVKSGDTAKLAPILQRLDPEDANFVRRGLLEELLKADDVAVALKKWSGMEKEMKDLLAPSGTEWRTALDQVVDNTAALRLLSRSEGIASTYAQAQQGLGLKALQSVKTGLGAAGGLGIIGGAVGGLTGAIPLSTALATGGIGVGLAASSLVAETAKRLVAIKGGARLIRSPAYMQWVASVTRALPKAGGKFNNADAAFDMLISLAPRAGAEIKINSVQAAQDMQAIQEAYLAALHEAEKKKQPRGGQGILGPVTAAPGPQEQPLAGLPPVMAGR